MAGPYKLSPGQIQYNIPTWGGATQTTVVVENNSGKPGSIEMTAGGSASETTDVGLGETELKRTFGGVFLAVKNTGPGDLTVSTN